MRTSMYDEVKEIGPGKVNVPEPRMMSLQTILMEQREMVADLNAKLFTLDRQILPSVSENERNANKREESNMINFTAGTTDLLRECHTILDNILTNVVGE